jgi:hypothetical protein
MKQFILLFASCWILISCGDSKKSVLFDGSDMRGWQTKGGVELKEGLMILAGSNSSAILKGVDYRDFDLRLRLRTVNGGKGSLGFHTDGSPGKGYSVAINNDLNDPVWWRMTGSLLMVRNLTKSQAEDGDWFDMNVRVEGRAVSIKINDVPVVEYIEPLNPFRNETNKNKLLSSGSISLRSEGEGRIEIENMSVEVLDGKSVDINAQRAKANDEQNDGVIRLHQEDFPVIDCHVHLKGGFTKEEAAKKAMNTGVNYAVAPNCGVGALITTDAQAMDFLDSMRAGPFLIAMQAEGREWMTMFSEVVRDEFDFVFTDAMTFTDNEKRRVRLWIDEEVIIEDDQRYVDMIVDNLCKVLEEEPVDVYVNPFFLPKKLRERYDELWTEERVNRVIDVIAKNGRAMEINEVYRIPNKMVIMKAKKAGVKFTFGTNNRDAGFGNLEYSIKMKNECDITQQDMYKPKINLSSI